jgi:hypothetical protein
VLKQECAEEIKRYGTDIEGYGIPIEILPV